MIPVPDLLRHEARLHVDVEQLEEVLGLAFTGRGDAATLDQSLAGLEQGDWQTDHFVRDLFVDDLVREHLTVELEGRCYVVNQHHLVRVLSQPPRDLETVFLRQGILHEMASRPVLERRAESLYAKLYDLLNMFRVPGRLARLDINSFRLDLFRLVKDSIDAMVEDFADAASGLRRLHDAGLRIQDSEPYRVLEALLDYDHERTALNVDLRVGATGKITELSIRKIELNRSNPFFQSTRDRWLEKIRAMFWHGAKLHDETIMSRLVESVYDRLATSLMTLGQLLGQLEVYLAFRQLQRRLESRGLPCCLADVTERGPLVLEDLYNPLLLDQATPPVPCSIRQIEARMVTLITGPNSGGKTRLLQSLGLAQLLGQGGFYVTASAARLVGVKGLYVSLIEHEAVDHAEGRLGRELERIRAMFDAIEAPSMVILDELCSGTNPSEGEEVFSLVLRLLERVRPVAFVTTHFLDYARNLANAPPVDCLRFLQVEVDSNQSSTYQFIPGVAETSLAHIMAERMGLTFDSIAQTLDQRLEDPRPPASAVAGG